MTAAATGPYFVTTKRPCYRDDDCAVCRERRNTGWRESSRAAATLEEARAAVREAIMAACPTWDPRVAHFTAIDVPSAGGTVGPLPDGTTIKVLPVTPWRLASFTDLEWTKDTPVAEIVNAYNAARAASECRSAA